KLNLYVDGGRVRGDRRQFATASGTIDAPPRSGYAKLEVPLAEGVTCAPPLSVEGTATGFRALIGCHKAEAAAAAEPAAERSKEAKTEARDEGKAAEPKATAKVVEVAKPKAKNEG